MESVTKGITVGPYRMTKGDFLGSNIWAERWFAAARKMERKEILGIESHNISEVLQQKTTWDMGQVKGPWY